MPLFDTFVQEMKYRVLRETARLEFEDRLTPEAILELPNKIIPEGKPMIRCCIYKERAIIGERIKLAMGSEYEELPVVSVLPIACDECPVDGIQVSAACRGCMAHRCMNACPRDAITIVDHKAHIDKEKCIECGRCMSACPYSAIVKNTRPCVNACKPGAISIDQDNQKAVIDESKCISCGACVYQCPFGAISDKSYILHAIRMIKESQNNTKHKVYAIVAPSIASQYRDVGITAEQACQGILELGFHSVIEAAWGADMVALLEARELAEKEFLTSSCCPAFVNYIHKNFPDLVPHISHNYSPMGQICKCIKEMDPTAKTVFIGPCIAKKTEANDTKASEFVDCVLTFEELQALFDAKDIDLKALPGKPLDNASYYGRIFARVGGLSEAAAQALKEDGVTDEQFKFNPIVCNGIAECKTALFKKSKNLLKENFIEGMACEHGCIGGPACLSHSSKDKTMVDSYGKEAMEKTIKDAVSVLDMNI